MLLNARTNYESETIHPLPYNETSFVFIGYDSREDIAYRVCEHSLIRRSSRPLTVIDLNHTTLRKGGYFDTKVPGKMENLKKKLFQLKFLKEKVTQLLWILMKSSLMLKWKRFLILDQYSKRMVV